MDTKKLKRKSKQGAFISLFGFFLILIGFGFAILKLKSLNEEIAFKSNDLIEIKESIKTGTLTNAELKESNSILSIQNTNFINQLALKNENITLLSGNVNALNNEVTELNEELNSKHLLISNLNNKITANTKSLSNLKRQVTEAHQELKVKRESIKQMDKTISELDFQRIEMESEKNTLNSFLINYSENNSSTIVPKATSTRDGKYYNFKIWLDIPESQLKKIDRVSYFFNHSSFKYPKVVVENSSNGFRTGYKGWGCLENMPIIITFNNGKEETIVFRMCEYIGDSSIKVK